MKIPVQGYEGIVRDTNSGAIINIAKRVHNILLTEQGLQKMQERLNKVEQDVSEIKDMLKQLIER